MIGKRPAADRILVAELTGEARHRARWRELSSDEEAAAVTALRELAGGRADLLAEVAGVLEGAREGELDEPLARQAAGLCRLAGADPDAIPAWAEEGRRRRANASHPPFSTPRRRKPPGRGLELWSWTATASRGYRPMKGLRPFAQRSRMSCSQASLPSEQSMSCQNSRSCRQHCLPISSASVSLISRLSRDILVMSVVTPFIVLVNMW